MKRHSWGTIGVRIGLLGWLLGAALGLMAQVDTLRQVPDSLSGSDVGRPASTFGPQDYTTPDSAYLPAWAQAQKDSAERSFAQRIQYRWQRYQAVYGPRLYESEAEKMRFYVRFPKRDSLDIPFPRGILSQPNPPPYDPTVAWQRSALLPGWGQAYNDSYWKIPVFYLGYAALGGWLVFNHQRYQLYGDAYFCNAVLLPEGADCSQYSNISAGVDTEGLRTLRNQFRQNRDNAILIVLAWHGLQVIEAFVDAHLKNFDVSPELGAGLRLEVQPVPINTLGATSAGLGVGLRF